MPVVGERASTTIGTGYNRSPISALAESFANTANNILRQEVDIFSTPHLAVMNPAAKQTLKEFYVNESYDANDPAMDARGIEDHKKMMLESFENECEAITENAGLGAYNPVIGMSIPMHKFILMNTLFDKGGIPKLVTKSPKWTETLQYPILKDQQGVKHDLFMEQHQIKKVMDATAPFVEYEVTLPENQTTDFLDADHLAHPTGNLSIASHISAVKIGEEWYPVNFQFTPTYGTTGRILQKDVLIKVESTDEGTGETTTTEYKDMIAATMNDNMFTVMSMSQGAVVSAVKLKVKVDTSDARVKTPSVEWEAKTDLFEIAEANPINVTISPELIKDVHALYNANQLSIVMSMIKTVLENNKDDTIKERLDESFATLKPWQKVYNKFDFAPREGYALDHVEWRKNTFMDALDTYVTSLVSVWRDPNVTVGIFGRPDLIRKVTPTEYTYHTPSSIGPVNLDFTRTVCTSDNRVYNFVSSMKLNGNNELIIVINPRNTDRFIYRIYDYQLYVSNEIRNAENPSLPAIHAFERFGFFEYQPVQGRLEILNPTGYRQADTDAWGYHDDNNGLNENNGYSVVNAAKVNG